MTRVTIDFCGCFTKATLIILKEVGLEDVDWIPLAQESENWCDVLNMEINLRVPYDARNLFNSSEIFNCFGLFEQLNFQE